MPKNCHYPQLARHQDRDITEAMCPYVRFVAAILRRCLDDMHDRDPVIVCSATRWFASRDFDELCEMANADPVIMRRSVMHLVE